MLENYIGLSNNSRMLNQNKKEQTLEKEISIWIRKKNEYIFARKMQTTKNERQNPHFFTKRIFYNIICVRFISQNGENVFGTH